MVPCVERVDGPIDGATDLLVLQSGNMVWLAISFIGKRIDAGAFQGPTGGTRLVHLAKQRACTRDAGEIVQKVKQSNFGRQGKRHFIGPIMNALTASVKPDIDGLPCGFQYRAFPERRGLSPD